MMALARRCAALAVVAMLLAACDSGSGTDSSSTRPSTVPSTVAAPDDPESTTTSTSTTLPADPELAAVRGHTIVVDAGHNGGNGAHASEISRPVFIGTQSRACDTTGTQAASGYPEHAYTLDVALRLRDLLAGAGANVVMIRTDDNGWGPCIDERAYIGNRANAEAGISIHADGGPTGGRGFHVNMPANIPGYTDDIYAASHTLGIALRDAYADGTGIPPATYLGSNGLLERRDFGGLNLSDVPKVLFETGNMQNAADAALIESPDFRARIARALAVGFARYFAAPGGASTAP
jgi:N-acetylmuramoyl-L-alanine amidase